MKLEVQALAGQIAKEALELAQTLTKPFGKLPEAEQQAFIEATEKFGTDVAEGATDLILAQGGGTLDVTIHNVTGKKETTQAVISCDRSDPLSETLFKSRHMPGKMIFVNVGAELKSLGDRAKPSPDQPKMFDDDPDPLFHEDGRVNDPEDLPIKIVSQAGVTADEDELIPEELVAPAPRVTKSTKPKPRKSPTTAKKTANAAPKRRKASPPVMDLASDG